MPLVIRPLLLALVLVAFGTAFFKASRLPAPAAFAVHPVAAHGGAPRMQSHFVSSAQNIQTHAVSLVELKDGRIRAFWFAGSREGAADVEIRSAVFNPAQKSWSAERTVARREETQRALWRHVGKLGNPVAGRAADGTLWLYYVTVSFGGWAGSSITAMASTDDGETWGPPRRLVTSPFLNLSTLVKGTPFLYADGTMGLPAYHEFIGKFGELLRFDGSGKLVDEQRLSAAKDHGLQPVLLAENANDALVLMRHSGDAHRKVVGVSTHDAGRHWSPPEKLALPNSDAALSAVALSDGRLLAALDDQEQGRDRLVLAVSADGGSTWKNIYRVDSAPDGELDEAHYSRAVKELAKSSDPRAVLDADPYAESARRQMCAGQACRFEFSYPCLIRAQNGDFHLAYTWNRSFIKHLVFNHAWLERQMKEAE